MQIIDAISQDAQRMSHRNGQDQSDGLWPIYYIGSSNGSVRFNDFAAQSFVTCLADPGGQGHLLDSPSQHVQDAAVCRENPGKGL